jgi:TnpA family transposase
MPPNLRVPIIKVAIAGAVAAAGMLALIVAAVGSEPKMLIELDRLERIRFVLDLLRSPPLRHAMQASLNKGEAGNNLRRAVFFNR